MYDEDVLQQMASSAPSSDSLEPSVPDNPPPQETYEQMARRIAREEHWDPDLTVAQMAQESRGKKRARSWAGAGGLMQLEPGTAARYGVTNVDDPEQNIRAGVRYMQDITKKFGGDKKKALAGYNLGPDNPMLKHPDWWNRIAYASNDKAIVGSPMNDPRRGPHDRTNTQNYVKNIWSNYTKGGGTGTTMGYGIDDSIIKEMARTSSPAAAPSAAPTPPTTTGPGIDDDVIKQMAGTPEAPAAAPVASSGKPLMKPGDELKTPAAPAAPGVDDDTIKQMVQSPDKPGTPKAVFDQLGRAYAPVDNQSGLKSGQIRVMPVGRENKSGSTQILTPSTGADGKPAYSIEQSSPDTEDAKKQNEQFAVRRKQKAEAVQSVLKPQVTKTYDFVKKGELDVPSTIGGAGTKLKYDAADQTGVGEGEYRLRDEDGDPYVYTPAAGKFVDEDDSTSLKDIEVPLGDPGANVSSVKQSQGEVIATAVNEIKPDLPRQDVVDFFSKYGLSHFDTGKDLTDPEYFTGGFTSPITGTKETPKTETYHLTQRGLNQLEAFSKIREDQRRKYVDANKMYTMEGNDSYSSHVMALGDSGQLSEKDVASLMNEKARLREAAINAISGGETPDATPVFDESGRPVPQPLPSPGGRPGITEEEIQAKVNEFLDPKNIAAANRIRTQAAHLAQTLKGYGKFGQVIAGANAAAGDADVMLAGVLRPFSRVPGFAQAYQELSEQGQAGLLSMDLGKDDTRVGWAMRHGTKVTGDLMVLAAMAKLPGLGRAPVLFATQGGLHAAGAGQDIPHIVAGTGFGYALGKVFEGASAAENIVQKRVMARGFSDPAEAALWNSSTEATKKAWLKTLDSPASAPIKRSMMLSNLVGKTAGVAVITGGTGGLAKLQGESNENTVDQIGTNLLFHFGGQAAGRIVRVWRDGKPSDYFRNSKDEVRKTEKPVPQALVEVETVTDPENPVYQGVETPPVPETKTAIAAQEKSAADQSQTERIAVMYPKGTETPKATAKQFKIINSNGDTILVDRAGWGKKAKELGVPGTKASLDNHVGFGIDEKAIQGLLGRVDTVDNTDSGVAVEATEQGKQVDAAVVTSQDSAVAQAASYAQQHPDADVSVKPVDEAIANRVNDHRAELDRVLKAAGIDPETPAFRSKLDSLVGSRVLDGLLPDEIQTVIQAAKDGQLPKLATAPEFFTKSGTDEAHDAATSPLNDQPEPTQEQKESGDYKKGKININGLEVHVENPMGSERSGTDSDGKPWSVTMQHHYGEIHRSEGADGEKVDVFVKDKTPENYNGPVFVVDQVDPKTGKFDEHKVMLGFKTEAEATEAYQSNYAKGWKGLGKITEMPFEEFKNWVKDGTKGHPVAEDKPEFKPTGEDKNGNPRAVIHERPEWDYPVYRVTIDGTDHYLQRMETQDLGINWHEVEKSPHGNWAPPDMGKSGVEGMIANNMGGSKAEAIERLSDKYAKPEVEAPIRDRTLEEPSSDSLEPDAPPLEVTHEPQEETTKGFKEDEYVNTPDGPGFFVRSEGKNSIVDVDGQEKPYLSTLVTRTQEFGPGAVHVEDISAASDLKQLTQAIADMPSSPSFPDKIGLGLRASNALSKGKSALRRAMLRVNAVTTAAVSSLTTRKEITDFKTALGDALFGEQKSAHETRMFVNEIDKLVPNKLHREAISNYIQAGGNEQLLRDRAAATAANPDTKHLSMGYEIASRLTDEEKALATTISSHYEANWERGHEAGILNNFLENYVNQVGVRQDPITQALVGDIQKGLVDPNFRFSRRRVFDTYFDREQAGFKNLTKDIGELVAIYNQSLDKAIFSRRMIRALTDAVSSDGRPVVALSGTAALVPETNDRPSEAFLIRPKSKGPETGDYRTIDHPALRKWKWVHSTEEGSPILMQGDMLVHPDEYTHLKNVLGTSAFRKYMVGRGILKVQATIKSGMMSLSAFHPVQIATHAAGHRVNPFAAVANFHLDFDDPVQSLLVKRGLQVSSYDALQEFGEGLAGTVMVNKIPLLGTHVIKPWQDYVFKDYIPRIKMMMALDAFGRNTARYSGKLSVDQIAELTAEQGNAAFGELNYRYMGRNPTMQDALRTFLLAPDFLEARAKFVGQAAKPFGREQLVALGLLAATQYISARILNQIFNGDPKWRMEDAFRVHYGNKWYGLRTVPTDLMHLITDPRSFAYYRMSPGLVTGVTAVTGRDSQGDKISVADQALQLLSTPVPITFRRRSDQEWWESYVNTFGLQEGHVHTDADKIVSEYYNEKFPSGFPKPLDKAKSEIKKNVVEQLRKGEVVDEDQIQSLAESGQLTKEDIADIQKSGKLTAMQAKVAPLPVGVAMQVYSKSDDDVKAELKQMVLRKIDNAEKKGGLTEEDTKLAESLGFTGLADLSAAGDKLRAKQGRIDDAIAKKESGDTDALDGLDKKEQREVLKKAGMTEDQIRFGTADGPEKLFIFNNSTIEDQSKYVGFLRKKKADLDIRATPAKPGRKPKAPLTDDEKEMRQNLTDTLDKYDKARSAQSVEKQNELVKAEQFVKNSLPKPAPKITKHSRY